MKLLNKLMATIGCVGIIAGVHAQDATTPPPPKEADTKVCSDCCKPEYSTPLGVMTDHIHPKGQFLLSYSYMNMAMKGNKIGSKSATNDQVYENYVTAPETMTMQMHMVMAMYGITNRLTAMAMVGYAQNSMSMLMNPNASMVMPGMSMPLADLGDMKMTSSGFTDAKIYALYSIFQKPDSRLIGSLGLNIPTGSITETGSMFVPGERLDYNMQIGTGSYGLLPSITYVHENLKVSYGFAALADIKMNNNSQNYRVGNSYTGMAWIGYHFLPFLSATYRMEGTDMDRIHGYDAEIALLAPNDPNADGRNYGGQHINGYVGLTLHFLQPALNKFHLLAEYGMPFYEHLNGTQMSTKSCLQAGLQYSF